MLTNCYYLTNYFEWSIECYLLKPKAQPTNLIFKYAIKSWITIKQYRLNGREQQLTQHFIDTKINFNLKCMSHRLVILTSFRFWVKWILYWYNVFFLFFISVYMCTFYWIVIMIQQFFQSYFRSKISLTEYFLNFDGVHYFHI